MSCQYRRYQQYCRSIAATARQTLSDRHHIRAILHRSLTSHYTYVGRCPLIVSLGWCSKGILDADIPPRLRNRYSRLGDGCRRASYYFTTGSSHSTPRTTLTSIRPPFYPRGRIWRSQGRPQISSLTHYSPSSSPSFL